MQAYQRLRGASLHSQSTNSKGSPSLCSSSLSVRTSIIFQGHRKQRCMTSASAFGHEAADPASAPIPVLRLERREALALLAGMTALSASPSWAEEGATSAPEAPSPSPATPTQVPPPSAAPAPPLDPYFSYPFVSSVPGNLRCAAWSNQPEGQGLGASTTDASPPQDGQEHTMGRFQGHSNVGERSIVISNAVGACRHAAGGLWHMCLCRA